MAEKGKASVKKNVTKFGGPYTRTTRWGGYQYLYSRN